MLSRFRILVTITKKSPMSYLPFASYTDQEVLRTLLTMDGLTDLELELAHRLEKALDLVAELEDELGDDA
jgi:hypothetical protein